MDMGQQGGREELSLRESLFVVLGQEGALGRKCFLAGNALSPGAAYKQQNRMAKLGPMEPACSGSNPSFATSQLWDLRQELNTSGPWFPLGIIPTQGMLLGLSELMSTKHRRSACSLLTVK